MKPLVILGTGGSAYDVLDVVDAINALTPTWTIQGFLDDLRPAHSRFLDWPVLGPLAAAADMVGVWFINVIGSDQSYRHRPRLIAGTGLGRKSFATLIHPQACVSSRARLGTGVLVNYGASVAGNVTIGDQVSLGPNSVVGHDSHIGDYSLLAPAAVVSGLVSVGRACYLGASSVVKQKIRIGDGALIGMGAVVTRDVTEESTVVGNPARVREGVLA